jgi:hypothetical protein
MLSFNIAFCVHHPTYTGKYKVNLINHLWIIDDNITLEADIHADGKLLKVHCNHLYTD